MRTLWSYLYFAWLFFWFWLGFFLIFPFVFIVAQNPRWHPYYFYLIKAWSTLFYAALFIPVKVEQRFDYSKNQKAIYCPNHFSFLDIPLLTRTMPAYFAFVGLHNLQKIPLFGYMYRKFHITVDRSKLRDRYATYRKSKQALEEGKNLIIFSEGGIWSENFPELAPFKDGPFRIAIEEQVPIIPVTIPYNWKMMPLLQAGKLRWQPQTVIFHEAISTQGMTLDNMKALKKQTYQVISQTLEEYFPGSQAPGQTKPELKDES